MLPPHPSGALPQVCPIGHDVLGTHTQWGGAGMFAQLCPVAQLPQSILPPQPLGAVPHS